MAGKIKHAEDAVQKAVLDYLRLVIGKRYIVLHVPNGGQRSRTEAAILKGLGVRAGAADILISGPDFSGWLEIKAERGKLSPAQEGFRDECLQKGIAWAEVRDVTDAVAFVQRYRLCDRQRGALRNLRPEEVGGMEGEGATERP